jgi:hypothetical protein
MGRANGEEHADVVLARRGEDRPHAGAMKLQLALVGQIKRACEQVWAADTSASGDEWTPANPSLGQCAVTSLLVQDICGGELQRSTIQGVSHYWNLLPGGVEIDLTRIQFGSNQELDEPAQARERDYVLSYGPTAERYELLRGRVLPLLDL